MKREMILKKINRPLIERHVGIITNKNRFNDGDGDGDGWGI